MKKGSHHNPESLERIRLAKLGTTSSPETRARLSAVHMGQIPWNKGIVLDEEARKKLSKSHMGITSWNKGIAMPEETKQKIREGNLGTKRSSETKARMSEAQRGNKNNFNNFGENAPHYGKLHNEETKKMMAEAHLGIYQTLETLQKISGENNHFYGKHHNEETKQKLREMRQTFVMPQKDTSIEVKLQNMLKDFGIQFETHKAILGQPDIFIEPNVVIYVDGCFWHICECRFDKNKLTDKQKLKIIYDQSITQKLIDKGYIVLRFWEHEINNDFENVKKRILKILKKEK